MRKSILAFASTLMIVALLLPVAASAKRITMAGSLTITRPDGSKLSDELVAAAVMSNPGLEKTVTQQLPLPGPIYVLPFFVDQEKGNSGPGNLDTVVALTNTTAGTLVVRLTLRGPDGQQLPGSPRDIALGAHATQVVSLSDIIE